MTAAGEPGRDDSGLPPVHIKIPDDARELERDVLAYHREVRARRRRQRLRRIFAPLSGPGTALPLIATCVALSLIAGAMLSFLTISPASAPTTRQPAHPPTPVTRPVTPPASTRSPAAPGTPAATRLPPGLVKVNGKLRPLRTLVSDVLVLIPAGCRGCGTVLSQVASQAAAAGVPVYFVASGAAAAPELASLTAHYGGGTATAVYDTGDVLKAVAPSGVTALVVHKDASAEVHRDLRPGAQLGDLQHLAGAPAAGNLPRGR